MGCLTFLPFAIFYDKNARKKNFLKLQIHEVPCTVIILFKYFKGLQDMRRERAPRLVIQEVHEISTLGKQTNKYNRVTQSPKGQLKN